MALSGKLKAKQVENAKPGRHADGGGLYLLVKPSGAKSWVLRIVVEGRRRDFGLGSVTLDAPSPEIEAVPIGRRKVLSLGEAREKAREGRRLIKNGLDPSTVWNAKPVEIPTFEKAARRYHEQIKAGLSNDKHRAQWLTSLENHVFDALGSKPVDQIDAAAVRSVLRPIWLTIGETARRIRQRIISVLEWCHTEGWREAAPTTRAVSQGLPKQRQPGEDDDENEGHFPSMPYAELPAFMVKLRAEPQSIARRGLEFLILTAARPGMVRGAPRSEINFDAAEWHVPGSRMKKKKRHISPLSEPAIDVLRSVWPLANDDRSLIFPGRKRGRPMSDMTMTKALRDLGVEEYVPHGFRSSFRNWAADNGYPDAWAERQLSHGIKDAVEAAYRRSTHLDQRRKMMTDWADFLAGESNVIALGKRA